MEPESEAKQQPHENTQERDAERHSGAEPDAPTSGEQNAGLSTILSADPLAGVQKNEGEE